jgi:hypothetical protein
MLLAKQAVDALKAICSLLPNMAWAWADLELDLHWMEHLFGWGENCHAALIDDWAGAVVKVTGTRAACFQWLMH